MTTVSRTNMCSCPSFESGSTGWTDGGNSTFATSTAQAFVGTTSFAVTRSNTSVGSCYAKFQFTATAGLPYTASIYFYGGAGAAGSYTFKTTGTAVSSVVSFNPGAAWQRVSVTVTAATTGTVSLWVTDDNNAAPVAGTVFYVDACLIEQSAALGTYFDGNTAAVNNLAYQWTGTAGSSTSQQYYALPTILATPKTDAPCPRTEVTVVGLGTGTTVFNVWRTADGVRKAVRGARNRSGVDSDFVVDYEAPLNRSLTYDIEVVSGSQVTQPTYPATVTVTSVTWWIQDPLVPSSAIPLSVSKKDSNAPYLAGNAIKALEYGASVTLIPILGSSDPVALMGNRTIAGNVSFDMFTNLATVTTQLRNLIQQTPLLLIRSTGTRNNGIPGLAYFTSAKPSEKPVTVAFGGTLTAWALTGDLVAAPTMNVLVPIWTYGNVAALWTTYQQAQTTLAGKTYLDVLKSPSGV